MHACMQCEYWYTHAESYTWWAKHTIRHTHRELLLKPPKRTYIHTGSYYRRDTSLPLPEPSHWNPTSRFPWSTYVYYISTYTLVFIHVYVFMCIPTSHFPWSTFVQHIYTYTDFHIFLCIYVYVALKPNIASSMINVCIHVHMYTFLYVFVYYLCVTWIKAKHQPMQTIFYVHVCLYRHACLVMYSCVCCVNIHVCTYMCAQIVCKVSVWGLHKHGQAYILVYIYIYIYIYMA
jgi:hypothetical protein